MGQTIAHTKEELKSILKSPNDKLIAIDVDGVLASGEWWGDDSEPKVIPEMKEFIWKLYKKGAHLIIYTARQPRYYPQTHAWLIKNEIPFHGICMCMKPGADIYLDDKSFHPEEINYD
jgi:uncharacterized HAD superfamily protein